MTRATISDKAAVVGLLAAAFGQNSSVQYILPQDRHYQRRMQALMAYSFDVCLEAGEVWLCSSGAACALVLHPERQRTSFRSVLRSLRLVANGTGLRYLPRILRREALIRSRYPQTTFAYLWFIGVHPSAQHQGTGTRLLRQVIAEADRQGKPVFLETSMPQNLPWYQRHGFRVYATLDFGFPLYCMRCP